MSLAASPNAGTDETEQRKQPSHSPVLSTSEHLEKMEQEVQSHEQRVPSKMCKGIFESPKAAMNLSLAVNIALFCTKLIISILSKSVAIFASLIDSLFDLGVQWVMFYIDKRINKQRGESDISRHKLDDREISIHKYPVGRTRLEGVGTIIVSTAMIILSLLIIGESCIILYDYFAHNKIAIVTFDFYSMITYLIIIVIKFLLWLFCRRKKLVSKSSLVAALASDHRNDVFSNSVALVAAYLASINDGFLWYCDSIGAILISAFIIYDWHGSLKDAMQQVVGITADKEYYDIAYDVFYQVIEGDIKKANHGNNNDTGAELQYKIEKVKRMDIYSMGGEQNLQIDIYLKFNPKCTVDQIDSILNKIEMQFQEELNDKAQNDSNEDISQLEVIKVVIIQQCS